MSGVPAWVSDVLAFWFGELTPKQWFSRDAAVDEAISRRFGDLHAAIAETPPDLTAATAETALATVLVLDQFPRHLFRGTPEAFASDPLARAAARAAVDGGLDRDLDVNQRLFLYLPFEHSEDPADQETSVRLISALGHPELTKYAVAHKVAIDRFGRFPHRNAVLGRASTPDEIAFLQEPMSSF